MTPKAETTAAPLAVIGVDIGKDVFHLVGFGADGKFAFRRRIRRLGLKGVFEKLPPCIVGMEACLSAHFVSRTLRGLGHEPRIVPAIYVKPLVKAQKNDYNDAEAICRSSAPTQPAIRLGEEPGSARPAGVPSRPLAIGFPPDSDDQPNMGPSDRARHCHRRGLRALGNSLFAILEKRKEEISPRTPRLICDLYQDWCALD